MNYANLESLMTIMIRKIDSQQEEIKDLKNITYQLLMNDFKPNEKENIVNQLEKVYSITQPKAIMSDSKKDRVAAIKIGILAKRNRKALKRA